MDADTRFFMRRGAKPGMENCLEHVALTESSLQAV
jgi:hypothetical protein